VSLYTINKKDLETRYKQIVGFYFVSSVTLAGIEDLVSQLIRVTLQQKYIGEKIPEAWFNFERRIKDLSGNRPLITLQQITEIAESSSLFDPGEILQAIRFLNDLGSLQYFEINGLKDKVVINPQWIVDVMACVVSVKKTAVKEGRLRYSDVRKIWSQYDKSLHPWMLKLTETFDLTYSVNSSDGDPLIIVPCLLPDKEPDFEWPEIARAVGNDPNADQANGVKIKEFQVII